MVAEQVRQLFDPQHIPEGLTEEQRQHFHPSQAWTLTGYPIVEGRYIDLVAGEVKDVQPGELTTGGPPMIDVYWHNMSAGDCVQFRGMRHGFVGGGIGEFVARLGKLLQTGVCDLFSLNVTTYSITVIVQTHKSREEVMEKQHECGLIAHLPGPRPACKKHECREKGQEQHTKNEEVRDEANGSAEASNS